jgi:hypothetical protein
MYITSKTVKNRASRKLPARRFLGIWLQFVPLPLSLFKSKFYVGGARGGIGIGTLQIGLESYCRFASTLGPLPEKNKWGREWALIVRSRIKFSFMNRQCEANQKKNPRNLNWVRFALPIQAVSFVAPMFWPSYLPGHSGFSGHSSLSVNPCSFYWETQGHLNPLLEQPET